MKTNHNGHEIRVVSLVVFVTTTMALLSGIGATATWALAQQAERAAMAEKVSTVVDKKLAEFWERIIDKEEAAKEIHDRLSERIAEANREIGVTRERVDRYVERNK